MQKDYYGRERRQHRRLMVNLIVIYNVLRPLKTLMFLREKEIGALTMDLSEGGMALCTNYNIPVETTLLIKFTLINIEVDEPTTVKSMEISGEVRYNILDKDGYRLGICFTQISQEDQAAIAAFVNISSLSGKNKEGN